MSILLVVWISLGIAAGAAHAAGIWRTTHHSGWSAVWRLPVVAAVLASAALAGALLPAAGGWASGLAATSAVLYLRSGR